MQLRSVYTIVFIFLISLTVSAQLNLKKADKLDYEIKRLDSGFQAQEIHLKKLNDSISSLNADLEKLLSYIDRTNKIVDTGSNSVSNQLSTASYILGIIGVLLLLLALYFNRVDARLRKIDTQVTEKLGEIKVIQEKVDKVKFDIENNPKKLFNQMQDQEVQYILGKVEASPSIFKTYYSRLMSLEINERFFDRFSSLIPILNSNDISIKTEIDEEAKVKFNIFMYYHFPIKTVLASEYLLARFTQSEPSRRQDYFNYVIENHADLNNRKMHLLALFEVGLENDENIKKLFTVVTRQQVNDYLGKYTGTPRGSWLSKLYQKFKTSDEI